MPYKFHIHPRYFIIVLIYMNSCSSGPTVENSTLIKNTSDSITFIFEKFPSMENSRRFANGASIQIDNSDFLFGDKKGWQKLSPAKISENDTMIVETTSKLVHVKHKINIVEYVEYLFHKGDTVLFTYTKGYPMAQVLNRKVLPDELNWAIQFRIQNTPIDEYSAGAKYYNPHLNVSSILEIDDNKNRVKFYPIYKRELEMEKIFLDSLNKENLISSEEYGYFSDRVKYSMLGLELENGRLNTSQVKSILLDHSDSISNSYYSYFLEVAVDKLFMDSVKIINIGHGYTKDFRQSLDLIQKSDLFKKRDRDQILFYQLSRIAENFPILEFKEYYKKFATEVEDTILLNKIKSTYFLDFSELRTASDQLHFVALNKHKATLDSIIKLNKGKVLYIDFWASWCGPCRKAMPASHKLRNKYFKKGVVILYLSVDKGFDEWKKASQDEGLEFYENNFLILNPQTSDFLKQLEFGSIPRYLIIGREGEIVHKNAPGPDSEEIEKLLLKLTSSR